MPSFLVAHSMPMSCFELSKLLHIWPQSLRVLAILPTYCQKMQNQTNLRVILSILVILCRVTNCMARDARDAAARRSNVRWWRLMFEPAHAGIARPLTVTRNATPSKDGYDLS
jgi:hypothetical protein